MRTKDPHAPISDDSLAEMFNIRYWIARRIRVENEIPNWHERCARVDVDGEGVDARVLRALKEEDPHAPLSDIAVADMLNISAGVARRIRVENNIQNSRKRHTNAETEEEANDDGASEVVSCADADTEEKVHAHSQRRTRVPVRDGASDVANDAPEHDTGDDTAHDETISKVKFVKKEGYEPESCPDVDVNGVYRVLMGYVWL